MSFTYEIRYTKAADKFFKRHESVRTQFEDSVHELLTGDHPERSDVKKIKGSHAQYYRIKLSGYRVIYTLINGRIVVVMTLLAGARGDVYKKKGKLK
ncbi:MAG: type II toxin-antitoxin system RelE/ParE family toxin [Lachnospiraceae bacterium]|nr:type II toxin-antitoxin system RelE/ParE family toxin [Lachnospiraceae bacterium]